MDLFIRQNFLQGFGIALNNRGIRIARKNMAASARASGHSSSISCPTS